MNTDKNNLTDIENTIADNIISKLQIYMTQTNQTLYSLASSLGFAYQPFYRLIKNRNIPTMTSLIPIANHLHCSVEELLSDKFILIVDMLDNINGFASTENNPKVKIRIPYKDYLSYVNDKFIALGTNDIKVPGVKYCKIYVMTDQINTDGEFIAKHKGKISVLNVISTSSKFIIVESGNEEQRISQDEIEPVAKLFNSSILFEYESNYITGNYEL